MTEAEEEKALADELQRLTGHVYVGEVPALRQWMPGYLAGQTGTDALPILRLLVTAAREAYKRGRESCSVPDLPPAA